MSTLPIQDSTGACPDCMTAPGRPHELSCREVSVDQFRAYLAEVREERERWERRDRRMTIAQRVVLSAVVVCAVILLLLLRGAR